MDKIARHNQKAWDRQARQRERWSQPVSPEAIAEAREGRLQLFLTTDTAVPAQWLGELGGREVLCLASGGGQQVPLLAAAGARVTSFDLSREQLALDQLVADRESLSIRVEQGDMRDLSVFEDDAFDLIIHVTSNVFCEDIQPVWRECYRVLRQGGELLAGFMNPAFFLFDWEELERGDAPVIRYALPYSDSESLSRERYQKLIDEGTALEFSHSLDDQIGAQIEAGFCIIGFFEDSWHGGSKLDPWFRPLLNTRALKG